MSEGVQCFEDLVAWQKARQLSKQICKITGKGDFARDFGPRDQIRRAAISVMSNLAEEFERGGRLEFRQFVVIAQDPCAEVRSQLYAAHDNGYLAKEEHRALDEMVHEVSKIIGGLLTALRKEK